MPDLPGDFAARLRAARAYSNLSQAKFADALNTDGASESTLKLWEKGTRRPATMLAPELVHRLAVVSGLPERFFWGEPDPPPPHQTAEQALDQLRTATRVMQDVLRQLGRDVGRRDLESRPETDQIPEDPQALR